MWLSFWKKKQFLLIFIPFYGFDQKDLFKQIQIFLRIFPFSNMGRKTNFLSISVLVSEVVTFMSKRIVLYEFPPKCFKTTERHGLAVSGSFCREKQFLLIFIPFYWFNQKKLFKTNPNFPQDMPLFKHSEKNKLSDYIWDSHFFN